MPRGIYKRGDRKEEKKTAPNAPVKIDAPSGKPVNGCKGCGHDKNTHYGSAALWCNVSGCSCKALS